jgi:hypothetical protein
LRALAALVLASLALALAAVSAHAATPDPMARGPFEVTTLDPFRGGTVDLQEPSSSGGAATGAAAAVTLQLRGSMYYPSNRATPAPVLVLVHGNHTQCDSGSSPFCTVFKRNDRGYAYLGENLASHGYAVVSLDQDQLMAFQDSRASGMHQRRLLIAAALDMLTAADAAPLTDGPNVNIGSRLVGKLDMDRIGLMGHSRGGDAVTSFVNWNRIRPEPGRRYNLRGVIALAPVDYERSTPWGVPHLSIEPLCDGDVSNLQGARFFERGQYALPGDPFPRIQQSVLGGNHNWFNSVWYADGDDSTTADPACGPVERTQTPTATSIRLSGGTYDFTTRGSGDPALMGDQELIGLATMSSFFRRYVGGESAFDPYVTGELSAVGEGEQIPATACPTSATGTRIACSERVLTSYFPGEAERRDVITPDPDTPLSASAVGTSLVASGFSSPYTVDGGVQPLPATTASGLDWCNPEPDHFAPSNIGLGTLPTAKKGCPLPGVTALGGQNSDSRGPLGGARENAPVNRSYGLQLAAAWDDPVGATGRPATLATRIPAASGDVSGFEALALGAAVNYFDPRNPSRTGDALWNASATTQDFTIALTDAAGNEATVDAGDHRYGNALHQTTGSVTARVHIILNQIRVPLADFAEQGVDLTKVRRLELRFGEDGKPASGSIQLADVRFQESVDGPKVLTDGDGAPAAVEPIDLIEVSPRTTVEKAGQVLGLSAAAPAAAAATGTPAAPAAERCLDTVAPTARITVAGKRLVRGVAADSGCGAKVAAVRVTVAKGVGGGRYRYLLPKGALSKARVSAGARGLVAKGTTSWSVTLGRLPAGTYRVSVRAIDAGGNARTAVKAAKLVVR